MQQDHVRACKDTVGRGSLSPRGPQGTGAAFRLWEHFASPFSEIDSTSYWRGHEYWRLEDKIHRICFSKIAHRLPQSAGLGVFSTFAIHRPHACPRCRAKESDNAEAFKQYLFT